MLGHFKTAPPNDCVLYMTGNNWPTIRETFQTEVNNFVDWTMKNNLRLNEDKTQAMLVGTRTKLSHVIDPAPLEINGKHVKFVKQYNYLGIILDNELTLKPMYKNVEKRVIDKVFMLRKLRKYLTYKAALQIYKQTIMPILDYSGLLLVSCTTGQKYDLQVIQNDVLRFCDNKKLEDKISVELLHKKANLSSLEQRRCKQILCLMYKISSNNNNIVVPNRLTRRQMKTVFRIDRKIGTKYASSPYYKGTKLWDKLTKEEQDSETIFIFKNHIDKMYKHYVKDFYI